MQNGLRGLLNLRSLKRGVLKNIRTRSLIGLPFLRKMASSAEYTNKLIDEKSPYLLQHAHNPVDWYPWGQEAFDKAKSEDKLIFLSVGYSTCHWCHVMERESFENPVVGALMNKLYVNIKVDREERPDVDKVYMTFVQATTHSGGWPMSVWLTPDLKPVVGGTYFPPNGAGNFGRPGFESVLEQIAKAWKDNRQQLLEQGTKITEALTEACKMKTDADSELPALPSVMTKCYDHLIGSYDSSWGGYGSAPKFPQPVNFQFMMRFYHANKLKASGKAALDSVEKTLTYMAKGGIHDHVAQGFSRYSTDRRWHVPHFEKMLYDQGQLAVAYTEIYQATQNKYFAEILEDIFLYVSRDLSNPHGGFYSGEDADSHPTADSKEKKEGAFCVWTDAEIRALLSKPVPGHDQVTLADVFCEHYNVKESGNVDPHQDPHNELTEQNVLIVLGSPTATANKFELSVAEVETALAEARKVLFDVRLKRPKPHRDTKMLAGWNGLMIAGMAKGGAALGRPDYVERAVKAAQFVRTHLYDSATGELFRSVYAEEGTQDIVQLSEPIKGFADDYGFLIGGLLDLFEATGDDQWLEWAEKLQTRMDELFWDDSDSESGGYFQSRSNDPSILIRMKDDQDGAEPSDNSKAAVNLIRLGNLTAKPAFREKVEIVFRTFAERLARLPYAVPKMVVAQMMFTRPNTQVVIVSTSKSDPEAIRMLNALNAQFLPEKAVIWLNGETDSYVRAQSQFLRDMQPVDGKTTAYVCKNYACSLPVHSVDEMMKQVVE